MKFHIPFSSKSIDYTEDELLDIQNSAKNLNPLTMGKKIIDFEKKFEKFINKKYAFAVNSATSALELTAQICNFKNDEEIIMPSHTYTSSCYPFIKNGAKIVWADIDLDTRVVSDESIMKLITEKTKAVLITHLYGYLKDLKNLKEKLDEKKIILIEDAAQAIGTKLEDKSVGTYGDFSIFSFHSHKNITTLGEGGMLVVNNSEIAKEIPKLRHNGHCDFENDRENYWQPAMGNLDISMIKGDIFFPNNFCISETQCSLGLVLLDRVNSINIKKRNRAINFIDELKNEEIINFHRVDTAQHNYHLLTAYFNTIDQKEKFFRLMSSEERIQCAVQYYPLNRYDFYIKLGYGNANCPNTDFFYDRMVSFPFHHRLSDSEIETILYSTKKVLKQL